MRVLVTGGTGFVGAAFAVRARAAGHQVVALDADPSADIACDVADAEATSDAIDSVRPHAIVHLAARLTDAAAADVLEAVRVNALGTAAVFVASARARIDRVIYASSNAAVGPCPDGSGDATPLAPLSIYGATKAFGEDLARAVSLANGSPPAFLALRFGWIYGPGRRRGWRDLQALIERVIAGERSIEYPDYPEPIDWTWIDDAANVLSRTLDAALPPFSVHNAMGDRRTVRDAFRYLASRYPDLDARPVPAHAPPSGWGLVDDGIARVVGELPKTRLETGLDRMIATIAP